MSNELGPTIGDQNIRFVLGNIGEASLGPWVKVDPKSVHDALKPYIVDCITDKNSGKKTIPPQLPARLVNRVNKALKTELTTGK